MTALREHTVKLLVLCLVAVMLGACKPCRIACPAGQVPECVAGQCTEASCDVPASCTCA